MEPKVEQRCFRYANPGSSGPFTKDVESIKSGLVLHDYSLHAGKTKSGQNVIILQNRKDVIENCTETCPRCINIYKRAKRLVENISTLGKGKTLGVCSNCGIKIQTDPSHCKCNVIFKEFVTSPARDLNIDEHNIETCLSKPNPFTAGFFKDEAGSNRLKLQTHSYSDSYLNRASKKYFGQKSVQKPTDGRQVKIRPLFQSEIDLSKLYITRTCHSFLQEQNATLGFRKTRETQPHDQTFQFHFIFPSKKKDPDSRLQVSSSELLHDFQANRKTNILKKKKFSAKTNKQTLPWQTDFSITSLQEKSIEFLHDIHAKYTDIKMLQDKILGEQRSKDIEKKNLGANTNKQTLPMQNDFSLLNLDGKALKLLHDIRAKYMETKILEDKILDFLDLEGNSLEFLQYIGGKYRKTNILVNNILAERRSRDTEIKNLSANTDKRLLSWKRDSSLLGLEGDSLELLYDIRGKYRKTKLLENKILAERRSSDLEMKNLDAKTNKQTLTWLRDSSLLRLKENSLELLNNIQAKYENKKRQLELIRDLEKSLGTKTKKHSWQTHYSLLSVETKNEEKKKKKKEQRNRNLESKIPGAKTKTHESPRQNNYSLLKLEAKNEEKQLSEEQRNRDLDKKIPGAKTKTHESPRKNNYPLLKLGAKQEEKQNLSEEQRNRDFDKKIPGAKTKRHELPGQNNYPLFKLEAKHEEKQQHSEEQRNRDLDKKILGAKTKRHELPGQNNYSLFKLEPKHEEKQEHSGEQRNRDLGKNIPGAKTMRYELPKQINYSLLKMEAKYEEKQNHSEEQRKWDDEKIIPGAKTKTHETPRQNNHSLLKLEVKHEEKQQHSEEQRNSDHEKKIPGAKTKTHESPRQNNYSLLKLEAKHEEDQKHYEEQHNPDLENNLGAKTKTHESPKQNNYSLLKMKAKHEEKQNHSEEQRNWDDENIIPGAKKKTQETSRQNNHSLLKLEAKHEEKQHSEEQRNRDLEKKIPGANTRTHESPRQNNYSLLKLEATHEEKLNHSEEQRNRDLDKKIPGAKTKRHESPRQYNYSLLKLEAKHEEKQQHSGEQRNRDLENKKPGAKTKTHESPRQNNYSLLKLEAKHDENQNHSEEQRNRDLENIIPGAKTKGHEVPRQNQYSVLKLEVKHEEKQQHSEEQLNRDLERKVPGVKKKRNNAKTKDNGLPWQKDSSLLYLEQKYEEKQKHLDKTKKKDSAHLDLKEETGRMTQASVIIDEQIKRYHKKKHVLNKKEDSFNELNHSKSEINVTLVGKTSEEIAVRRKKNQAVLEMLTRIKRKNISGISLPHRSRSSLETKSTELPTERVVRKMNVYDMVPCPPEFDWFAKNKAKREMFYDSGEILAEFSEDGRSRWFYRDGKLALDYYTTEKTPPGRRYVVYSSGTPDRKGRPRPQTVLASFDHSGNAVIFDHAGNIRLKYDQNEGVLLDHSIGPMTHWKWHSVNRPPATTDTEKPFIDPEIQMGKPNEPTHKQRMHKLKKPVHGKRKKVTLSYKRFEIQMKALKINENFSLKILDQAKVYLIYRDGTTHIKINIGMTLNGMGLVDIVTCYVGDVYNPLEKSPADTRSVVELQRTVAHAQHAERARVRHLVRLMRPSLGC